MNHQKRSLTSAALLSVFLVTITCLSALAESPRFYVRLENPTNQTLKYEVDWCTRAGFNHTGYQKTSINPVTADTIRGPEGCGRMNVRMKTQGEDWQTYSYEGVTDSRGGGATHVFYYNKEGRLRLK
jgi:hypothetical protein